jgi:hypothetical protein
MNYYIIPKNNFHVKINLQLTTTQKIEPFISYSFIFYINDIYNQLLKLQENNEDANIDYINKIVNPFEFIHSNVPGSSISVSKVKPDSNIFFELMELFQIFNITDSLSSKQKIHVAHFTHNYSSTNELLNIIREENEDNIILENFDYDKLCDIFLRKKYVHKFDLIICEFMPDDYNNTRKYINNLLLVVILILKYQSNQGMCVIKMDNILYKPIIDIIFILSSIYDKVYLVKPMISNITKGDRYFICRGFNENTHIQSKILSNIDENMILNLNNEDNPPFLYSIIDNELPNYLLNKIEESNLVIGQQQLEAYDQIINIFKNKNREEKLEHLKRTHIQKCIQWCEKNQLPHNKFVDKVNIFLMNKKKKDEDDDIEDLQED